MTTVRIAHAEPRPGGLANGEFQTRGHLVVLADDTRRRAVPFWMRGDPGAGDDNHIVMADNRDWTGHRSPCGSPATPASSVRHLPGRPGPDRATRRGTDPAYDLMRV